MNTETREQPKPRKPPIIVMKKCRARLQQSYGGNYYETYS